MNELYEFAKQVDVFFIFAIIYVLVVNTIGSLIMGIIHWIKKQRKKLKEKKTEKNNITEE
ncbi:MAG: hypothetical protein PWP56_1762 [Acetobacterium sp.]|jgi:fluoride ion exporter CrcB/FEX|uniref:hypothetical protein n=1 Tax=Acetobacterium sp. K1/6 TaxID=3055467 RepID=UPI0029E218C2|nr:hypothetical protein [Acetobacterium sp. K1/6]MDK2942249.1 hypothetical protein [Acetobacterium sp.]MDZ5723472.1 hypothetical protein [Acetobacterium sp. K1/6]